MIPPEQSSSGRPSRPVIAAVLIARDEARCILRCLESIRPWVDRMVVLDTGSSDDTAALARQCGAEVHHMAWPDDFSIARNRALELADADWNLVIDADEWLHSGGDMLHRWCDGSPRLGQVCIHSSFDPPQGSVAAAASSSRSWITRVLPRGVRFEGRVHEQVASSLPREHVDLHVEHDGYLDAQIATKRERNLPLLLRELEDHPEDPYIQFQLGKESEGRDEFAAAGQWYARALTRTSPDANWRHELLVRHLHCLGRSGRVDEALGIAEQQIEIWQDSPDFFFVLGNLLLDRAMSDPAQAIGQWLPLAGSAWERCLEIGERPDLDGSVHGRGSHLARHNLDILKSQMALFAG